MANPALEPTLWGDQADPDKDGVSNHREYLFGSNPLRSDAQTTAPVIGRDIVPDRMVVSFRCRSNDPALTYWLESSVDLVNWNLSSAIVEDELVLPVDSECEWVTRYIRTTPGSRLFFRIRVE